MSTRPAIAIRHFDVAVIGGGIIGIALARELSRAGKRVLLLEKHDFASGTTSRSTRIIHGGLRYLEHGEIGLVRESLRERDRLLREHPHLVRPMHFVLAMPKHRVFSRRGSLALRAGLQMYKWFSSDNPLPTFAFERELDLGDRLAIFDYQDAQCEFPERLAAEWLIEAWRRGAVVRNHAEVQEINRGNSLAVLYRDTLSDEEDTITADAVVNATGPWVDSVCEAAFPHSEKLIDGVRGSHILLERFAGAPDTAIYTEAPDGRPFFVIPWNGQLLVGTTELRDDSSPDSVTPSESEIEYLLAGFNRLYPYRTKTRSDVIGMFCGVRALPTGTEPRNLCAVTRRSFIHDHANDGFPGMYSIVGGKLTTAAAVARQCARSMGLAVEEPEIPHVALGTASGFDSTLVQWSYQAAALCGVSPESAQATAEWHGRCAFSILRRAQTDRPLARPIVDGTDHLLAEAVHAVQQEYAMTLGDILLRRVPIALTGHWSEEQSIQAAERIGMALRWSAQRFAIELERLEDERDLLIAGGSRRSPRPTKHAA
jgi:glycerol-3-phosphate dehydrogenase